LGMLSGPGPGPLWESGLRCVVCDALRCLPPAVACWGSLRPASAGGLGHPIEVGWHGQGLFAAADPGQEPISCGAFSIHVPVSAPVRAAEVVAGFRSHQRLPGLVGSEFNRAAMTRQ
jgi:hypothetical protein